MRRVLPVLLLVSVCFLPACHAQDTSQTPTSLPPIEVYFSPKGGCTEAVVKELGTAKTSVLVQPSGRITIASSPVQPGAMDYE
jgi:hypothetical protein